MTEAAFAAHRKFRKGQQVRPTAEAKEQFPSLRKPSIHVVHGFSRDGERVMVRSLNQSEPHSWHVDFWEVAEAQP